MGWNAGNCWKGADGNGPRTILRIGPKLKETAISAYTSRYERFTAFPYDLKGFVARAAIGHLDLWG
jgi:hypothetical protein